MDIARDLALGLDPALFARHVGLEMPDPWQAQVLRSGSDRLLLLCSRQAGKSTVTACLALHTALYHPGALVLLLSPSQRQSSELFRKVTTFYEGLAGAVPSETENALSLELVHGSRIVSLPGKEGTIRGYSGANLIVIDEAARVPDDLYLSVRPMLAISKGKLVAMTTPFGKRGWFFQEWTRGGEIWARFKTTAYDCPRISKEFLEEERRVLGDWWFAQEYLCEFTETDTSLFTYEQVANAITADVKPLF